MVKNLLAPLKIHSISIIVLPIFIRWPWVPPISPHVTPPLSFQLVPPTSCSRIKNIEYFLYLISGSCDEQSNCLSPWGQNPLQLPLNMDNPMDEE